MTTLFYLTKKACTFLSKTNDSMFQRNNHKPFVPHNRYNRGQRKKWISYPPMRSFGLKPGGDDKKYEIKDFVKQFPTLSQAEQQKAFEMLQRMISVPKEEDPVHEKWLAGVSCVLQDMSKVYEELITTNSKVSNEILEINKKLLIIKQFCAQTLAEDAAVLDNSEFTVHLHMLVVGCDGSSKGNQMWISSITNENSQLQKKCKIEVELMQKMLENSRWVYSVPEKAEELIFLNNRFNTLKQEVVGAKADLTAVCEKRKVFNDCCTAFLDSPKEQARPLISAIVGLEKIIPIQKLEEKVPDNTDFLHWKNEVVSEFKAVNKLEKDVLASRDDFLKKIKEVREGLEEQRTKEQGYRGRAVQKILSSRFYVSVFGSKTLAEATLLTAAFFALGGGIILLPWLAAIGK